MSFSFEPQLIKQDSAVPLRMIVGGWAVGSAAILMAGSASNTLIGLMGLTLVAGGLVALALTAPRTARMVLGSIAGAIATQHGYQFAFVDRLIPARDDLFELLDRDHIGALALGLSVMAIGLGGLLESIRAQSDPGSSPTAIRVLLIAVGTIIALRACSVLGVSTEVTIFVAVATAAGLGAMAWLRNERSSAEFTPRA